MKRHHRDRDMVWLASGLPFLTWATAAQAEPSRTPLRGSGGADTLRNPGASGGEAPPRR